MWFVLLFGRLSLTHVCLRINLWKNTHWTCWHISSCRLCPARPAWLLISRTSKAHSPRASCGRTTRDSPVWMCLLPSSAIYLRQSIKQVFADWFELSDAIFIRPLRFNRACVLLLYWKGTYFFAGFFYVEICCVQISQQENVVWSHCERRIAFEQINK